MNRCISGEPCSGEYYQNHPGVCIPLVTPATVSPTYEQGQVRDTTITHLFLYFFGHHSHKAALATLAPCVQWAALVGPCPTTAVTGGRCAILGTPLSAVSGHKRYNTLDFAGKVVCQQGCCSPLLDDPEQRGGAPLEASSAGMEAHYRLLNAGGVYCHGEDCDGAAVELYREAHQWVISVSEKYDMITTLGM